MLRPEDAAAVEEQWRALAEAGLPSQAAHGSATNAPHLTLVSAAVIPPQVLELAAAEIAPLLPQSLRVHGLVWLGARRPVLALLLHPPVELTTVVERLRDLADNPGPRPWLPHLTLGAPCAGRIWERRPRRCRSPAASSRPVSCGTGIRRPPRWRRCCLTTRPELRPGTRADEWSGPTVDRPAPGVCTGIDAERLSRRR